LTETSPDSEIFDIISPYGYPGILVSEAAANDREFLDLAMNELKKTLQSMGVCSAFFRLHPILNEKFPEIFSPDMFTFNGETISVDLTLSEAQIWSDTNSKKRNKINKCKRLGMTARVVRSHEYLEDFWDIYKETMERVGALEKYFTFDHNYLLEMQDHFFEHMFLCLVEMEGEIASAGLYTECNGIVQGVLGGTRNKYYQYSPTSLETDYVRMWAKQRGNKYLHLGGGVGGAEDELYHFKCRFSKLRHNFYTLRLITDAEKYNYLVDARAKALNTSPENLLNSNFFPAYRSPK
ncbi:MAG: peptidoglycan bridge formation glycyltransferase FemA/FemB family protein, partial [Nostocaceae cyanobacterium]|nr:peptidoglycan bridge formation glycyltransferase FemA/FemB family protein [Nostocaceae cyanobacterium]